MNPISALIALIREYPVVSLSVATAAVTALHHAFDAAVDSMPAPTPQSSVKYQFWYAWFQKFAGNYRKVQK